MAIQYPQMSGSTTSLGRVGFITSTAALFAVSGITGIHQGLHLLRDNSDKKIEHKNEPSLLSNYNWEARLLGSESTGGEKIFDDNSSNFSQISAFALNLLGEQSDLSEDFEKLFSANFWDILA